MRRRTVGIGLLALLSAAVAGAETASWSLPADWERGVVYAEVGDRVEIRGEQFGLRGEPAGAPALPFLSVELPVPEGVTLEGCTVMADWEPADTTRRPTILELPHILGTAPHETAEDPRYFGAAVYPADAATATLQTFSRDTVILACVTPYRWNGVAGRLEKARTLTVTCSYAAPTRPRRVARAASGERIDMVFISPPAFVDLWPTYVDYRKTTHPELHIVVKNTSEIYANYEGADDGLKIHKYLEDLYRNNGLKYAILGAGSQKGGSYDPTREIPTRDCFALDGVGRASDLYYSCMDKKGGAEVWDYNGDGIYLGSRKAGGGGYAGDPQEQVDWTPDIACFRFPVRENAFLRDVASKAERRCTAKDQVDGLVAKLRRVESPDGDFAGNFKAGYSGKRQFFSWSRGQRHDLVSGEAKFFDGHENPWSAQHAAQTDDWEFMTRGQIKNRIARNRPLVRVYSASADVSTAGNIYGNDLEINNHASHGQEMTAAPFQAYDFFTTTKIQKILNFCNSCLTGRLDLGRDGETATSAWPRPAC